MAIQDRNIHRDAQALRKSVTNICSLMISAKPRIEFKGVRSSWLMTARKSDLARLASS